MNRDDAIHAAAKAAGAVYAALGDKKGPTWQQVLHCGARELHDFVAAERGAPAAALYGFAVRAQPAAPAYEQVSVAMRVACEVFVGSLRVMLQLVEAAEQEAAIAAAAQRRMPAHMAALVFDDRADGMSDRVDLMEES